MSSLSPSLPSPILNNFYSLLYFYPYVFSEWIEGGGLVDNLIKRINKPVEVNEELIREYHMRNERKKEDEKWLQKHRNLIINELKKLNKDVIDYGNLRVSIITPKTSKFDKAKVLEFAEIKGIKSKVVKEELDEDKLTELVEKGEISLDELKEYAWVESIGSPRMIIKELERDSYD